MKILALDQSTNVNGYSIWENAQLKDFGHFKTEDKDKVLKMADVGTAVKELINKHSPDYAIIEGVQFQKNYKVYSTLSQLQGFLFAIFMQVEQPFIVIEPTSWKSFSEINLRNKREAQKAEAIQIVKTLFGEDVTEDEADAILMGRYAYNFVEEIKG